MNLISCLKSFVMITDCRSFSAAARKLYVSPAKLSKQISWLEEEWKTQLFQRSTRQLALTKAGKRLYEKATWLLKEIADMKNELGISSAEPQGEIRLYVTATTISSYITQVVVKFIKQYPNIRLTFLTGHDLLINFTDQSFDLAVMTTKITHPNFICKKFKAVKRSILGTPQYFKQYGTPKTLEDLLRHNCLLNTHPLARRQWTFGKKTIHVSGNLQSNDFEVLKQAALADLGIIWAPAFLVAQELKEKRLQTVLNQIDTMDVDLFIVYPKVPSSPNTELLLNFLIEEVTQNKVFVPVKDGFEKTK